MYMGASSSAGIGVTGRGRPCRAGDLRVKLRRLRKGLRRPAHRTTMADAMLMRCSACGVTNRVPREKVAAGLHPRCGRCSQPLTIQLGPVTVTDNTFAADVERSPLPVLVDAWAPWCGPCRTIAPVIAEQASELDGHLRA